MLPVTLVKRRGEMKILMIQSTILEGQFQVKTSPLDRSDRVGEDNKMVTRVDIQAKGKGVDQELLDIIETEELHQQKQKKDAWKSTLSDVDDLLNDD